MFRRTVRDFAAPKRDNVDFVLKHGCRDHTVRTEMLDGFVQRRRDCHLFHFRLLRHDDDGSSAGHRVYSAIGASGVV